MEPIPAQDIIAGVHVPGHEALDMVNAALPINSEALGIIQNAIAEPIAAGLGANKDIVQKARARPQRVVNGTLGASSATIGQIIDMVSGAIGAGVDINATHLNAIGALTAAAGPGIAPAPTAPVVTTGRPWYLWFDNANCQFAVNQVQPPTPLAGAPATFSSSAAAYAWIAKNGKAWIAANAPGCGPTAKPTSGGIIVIGMYTCNGLDGNPAWAVTINFGQCNSQVPVGWGSGHDYIGQPMGSPNWNPFTQYVVGYGPVTLPCNITATALGAAVAAASIAMQQGFAAFSATCAAGAPPPAPIPGPQPAPPAPAPAPPPGGQPQPAPPPGQGEVCEMPGAVCIAPAPNTLPCVAGTLPMFPAIGSAEFIQAKDNIKDQLAQLGDALITLAKSTGEFQWSQVGISVGDTSIDSWGIVKSLWSTLSSFFQQSTKDAIDTVKNVILCWYNALSQSTACNVRDVLRLAILRAFINLLKHARLGTDLAIWATSDIVIELEPLEKLLDYLIADACPAELPHFGDIVEAWMRGGMDDDTKAAFLRFQGIDDNVWQTVIAGRRERITYHEWLRYSIWQGVPDVVLADDLRSYGFTDQIDVAKQLTAWYQPPTVSDLLHFLQRNVFDTQYVTDYGLLEGFKDRFWARYEKELRANGINEVVAADHYAAHWIIPAIGQLSEMVCRLRVGRVDAGLQFTKTDFLRVLAEQDIAPYFRERLLKTAFRTLPLRQLNQLTQTGQLNYEELVERWQDICFTVDDAKLLARGTMIQAARTHEANAKGYTPATVADLAEEGLIDKATAVAKLQPQGFSAADVDTLFEVAGKRKTARQLKAYDAKSLKDYAGLALAAYQDGVVSANDAITALTNAGFGQQAAMLEVQTADLKRNMQKADDSKKAVRKAFLRGELNDMEAFTALQAAGYQTSAATDYVQRWKLEMTVPRKAVNRSMINKWAVDGLISASNARQRLLNLGYAPDVVNLDMIEIAQTIKHAQQLAAERKAKELRAAQAEADRATKQITSQYCKLYTPGKLKLWYSERVIDQSSFYDKLSKCGYSQEAADLLFREAQVAREKKDDQAAAKGKTGIEYAGPGADTG